MKHAKSFVKILFATYIASGLIFLFALSFTHFYGDLTRIGSLPEYYFGWKKPQPKIDSFFLKSVKMKDADILVIGDSFSEKLFWQSVLIQHTLKIKTLHWQQTGPICENFEDWLAQTGFRKNGTVIFETVQRSLNTRLEGAKKCKHMKNNILDKEERLSFAQEDPFSLKINFSEKVEVGFEVLSNLLKIFFSKQGLVLRHTGADNTVRVQNLPDGCKLFSNRWCNKVLTLYEDELFDLPNELSLYNIEQINGRLHKYKPSWVVIPDKSTVYLNKSSNFWSTLEDKSLGPNLLKYFQKAKTEITDFYAPNDTHLSTAGFLKLGEIEYNDVDYVRVFAH